MDSLEFCLVREHSKLIVDEALLLLCPCIVKLFVHIEPRCEETVFSFRLGPTQTSLYRHRRWLEAENFGFKE